MGVKDDVYQQVMDAVENQTKQPQLTTAQIYNTVLSELKKLDGAAAAAFEQEHIRAEKSGNRPLIHQTKSIDSLRKKMILFTKMLTKMRKFLIHFAT
ncbi:hypothetical protein ACG92U_05935 [Leuconostoc citreum]